MYIGVHEYRLNTFDITPLKYKSYIFRGISENDSKTESLI